MTAIQDAAKLIHEAKSIAVFTGAGVSKESGIPTFRDEDGVWNKVDPQTVATREALYANPEKAWEWYRERHALMSSVKPNAGHHALAQLEKYKTVHVITQNIDDLHEQAGSTKISHLHGKYNRYKCAFHCQGKPTLVDFTLTNTSPALPPCPHCGRWIRADVVLFGEILPAQEFTDAEYYSKHSDLMIVVGTTGLVSPADSLPRLAKQNGAKLIEVNPSYSMISRFADIRLEAASGLILPHLITELEALGASS
jgi:NAD-dependent deacetylase